MSEFKWRSAQAYQRTEKADITGLAWECLRRDPDYQIASATQSGLQVSEAFRREWCVCFRS